MLELFQYILLAILLLFVLPMIFYRGIFGKGKHRDQLEDETVVVKHSYTLFSSNKEETPYFVDDVKKGSFKRKDANALRASSRCQHIHFDVVDHVSGDSYHAEQTVFKPTFGANAWDIYEGRIKIGEINAEALKASKVQYTLRIRGEEYRATVHVRDELMLYQKDHFEHILIGISTISFAGKNVTTELNARAYDETTLREIMLLVHAVWSAIGKI
ncbi:hypothetical protein [Bacillus sp. Marseille-P3800]|uniref:hypothetical protein n=1 Tax=Bacillus sp. Marseille-P3800 TaxID=2014782 RepID=UPI000C06C272|nr:hypothetical protein [Bacillus sp. Marseille-P3800]